VRAEEEAGGAGGLAVWIDLTGDQDSAAVLASAEAIADVTGADVELVFDDFDAGKTFETTLQIAGWLFVLFVHPGTSDIPMRHNGK
jgi:hypothetical protein